MIDRLGIDRNVIKPTVTGAFRIPPEVFQILFEKQDAMIPIVRNCIGCMHFAEHTEQCAKQRMRPPARVIAFGCPMYENDDIPY